MRRFAQTLWLRHPRSAGFTIVELMVVIAVIGILSALVLSGISSTKEKAKRIRCLNNLKQFITASHLHANDNEDKVLFGLDNNNGSTSRVGGGYKHCVLSRI